MKQLMAALVSSVALSLAAVPALAEDSSPVAATQQAKQFLGASVVLHGLQKTILDYGSGGTSLASGFNTIDTATVTCGGTCTIGVEAMVQISPGSSGTFWAICPAVDGFYTNPPCPYQGLFALNGSPYVTGNGRGNITVAKGVHTVTTQVYVSDSGTLGIWESDIRHYQP